MSQLTVYLNKNSRVITVTVKVTDAASAVTTLTIPNFKPWTGGGAHAGDWYATVDNFADKPSFTAELDITTGSGGRALVTFAIDGKDKPTSECLKADWQNTHDVETIS